MSSYNLVYLHIKKVNCLIIALFFASEISAQLDSTVWLKSYYRKEEIIYNNKRYRIYNNYLTLGAGYANSSFRNDIQKTINVDFNFHIRKLYFQSSFMISGSDFLGTSDIELKGGVGYRKEQVKNNMAAYVGAGYSTGAYAVPDPNNPGYTMGAIYEAPLIYACASYVYKLEYDIGAGLELFTSYSTRQFMFGGKLILYFSGAYRGPKKTINKYVRPLKYAKK
ncbi:MAG: hypothetical protein JSU07_05070 [Bacteroidetes bacterium]|nr:hypothetical protein [Bacteroidota bacterium]